MLLPRRLPASSEAAVPLAILLVRILRYPPAELLRDWLVIVCLYWIFTIFRQKSRSWPMVSVASSALLLGIYVSRQVPVIIDLLGR
jgi:hypothetical protein